MSVGTTAEAVSVAWGRGLGFRRAGVHDAAADVALSLAAGEGKTGVDQVTRALTLVPPGSPAFVRLACLVALFFSAAEGCSS